jgi:hypothetical protein
MEDEETVRQNILKNKRIRTVEKLKRIPQKHYLMTTRFNNKSHAEMLNYCQKIKGLKCIYGVPREISIHVVKESIMFVLEMNNDLNRIEGVGMLKNVAFPSRYAVYEDGNYNRFSYLGKTRIARENMTVEEEQIMQVFDILCFKSKFHQKRCQGITMFPPDILEKCKKRLDLTDFVANMFKSRIK